MQGRLLPKYQGRYQAHPVGYWQDEFPIAAELGLDCIEFILDFNDVHRNPLMSDKGIAEIQSLVISTGVRILTVCADYFMEAPLHSEDRHVVTESQTILKVLLENGKRLNLSDIVMPCVDQASLIDLDSQRRFIENLTPLLTTAEHSGINISLETDLAPEPFAELIAQFTSDRVTVNYDTGNSAALGFDPQEELQYYGRRISDIHIKDRIHGGGSVMLGTGNTQFHRFFHALTGLDYRGPFIMQAYRDDEGLVIFRKQLNWLKGRQFLP